MNSGCASYSASRRSPQAERRKKYDGSRTHATGAPEGATRVPSARVTSSSSP